MKDSWLHYIGRPIFGLIMLQPVILLWFMLFADDWWADYQTLGWPLQIICTLYLIPVYRWYEKQKKPPIDWTPKWL